ncbi:MAG TPA: asparagine--tRNA ligase [Planctomycetota bacterium]|nr:asparagine--tRNA ligase [Planctomycetota bacterium]
MPHVTIERLDRHVGEEVTLKGWLYNCRSKGKIHFLQVRDGTGICQCVLLKGVVDDALFERLGKLGQESSLEVTGRCKAEPRAPGGYELELTGAVPIQDVKDYPIALQEHGPDFLLQNRHLWLRSKKQHAVMRIRNRVEMSIRQFFDEAGFVLVDAPVFTPAACEGTTTLFEVKYFEDDKAFLTQSGQLYMEAAAMALGKVYCFGPVFRAEKSKTRKHLTEFWMVEPEIAYGTLDDVMDCAEALIVRLFRDVRERCATELATLERDLARIDDVIRGGFPRVTYHEAADILLKNGTTSFKVGDDFGAPDEAVLGEHFGRPVMIHRWPHEIKAFYMKRDPGNPALALGVDMIAPDGYGEVVGGGQRADDLDFLLEQIRLHKLPQEAFEWYLDLRRYGTCPHAGFGLGLERTVNWICGREHVRECIPFPRMMYRIYP